jgi:hypothetical protein
MPAQVRIESQKWLSDKQRVEVVIAFGEGDYRLQCHG